MYFLQTNSFWDPNLMSLIDGIKNILPNDGFVSTAKEIAAVLALIYLSVRAYAMIVGEGKLEVMQLFRPFIITVVIVNFGTYAAIVDMPGKATGNKAQANFEANAKVMDDKFKVKYELNDQLWTTLIEQTNELKKVYYDSENDPTSYKDYLSLGTRKALLDMGATITVYEKLFWIKIKMWLQSFIMWIVMGVFKGICYCIFFVQLILMHILLILGPLSFGFSIAGAFRDSWVHWTTRYIAVSFYTTIGFIVLNIAVAILTYGLDQEIDRLRYVISEVSSQAQFIATVSSTDNFIGYLLIAMVVAVAGIISVPVISTWIIQTSGAGSAFFGTATSLAGRAGRAVQSLPAQLIRVTTK